MTLVLTTVGKANDAGTEFVNLLGTIPTTLEENTVVTVGADSFAGAEVSDFQGGDGNYSLEILGTYSAITPTTGVASGTAGAGTNTTTLVKPTAAANWTANNLVGKFVKITGGGGAGSDPTNYPVVRAISANTTTNLTVVKPVTGMDSTTTFALVDVGAIVTEISANTQCLVLENNQCPVILRGLRFSGEDLENLVFSSGNKHITFDGCVFDVETTGDGLYSDADEEVIFSNCILKTAATAAFEDPTYQVLVDGVYMSASGPIYFTGCDDVRVENLVSTGATSNVIRAVGVDIMKVEASSTNATATPFYFETVRNFEAIGTNKLTGTNASAPYGIEIQKDGFFNLEGSDVAGGQTC